MSFSTTVQPDFGTRGRVILVGAGPGDPGLITMAGVRALERADVVIYDRLVHPDLLDHCGAEAERIFIGKAYGRHVLDQQELNNLLVYLAASGRYVVRLKGGDPFVFGRGGEEAEHLAAHGIDFEVVPGVSSAVAAPAYAGIPVTDRRYTSSVTFVTGHRHPDDPESTVDWAGLAACAGTIVVFMGLRHAADIAAALVRGGKDPTTPVALIEWGTHERQRTIIADLASVGQRLCDQDVVSPALLVIGDVVRLRDKLAWFEGSLLEAAISS